jgi:hypothetical protein
MLLRFMKSYFLAMQRAFILLNAQIQADWHCLNKFIYEGIILKNIRKISFDVEF